MKGMKTVLKAYDIHARYIYDNLALAQLSMTIALKIRFREEFVLRRWELRRIIEEEGTDIK